MPTGLDSFAGGFAEGFTASRKLRAEREEAEREARQQEFENRLAIRQDMRLSEQLGLQREEFDFQRESFGQQMGLEERRFEEQQRQFSVEQQGAAEVRQIQQRQQRLQERRFEFEQKQADAKALQSLLNLKKVPKGVRRPFIRQQARASGIDVNSPEFKEMEQAIVSMQDEELNSIVDTIVGIFPDLPPGQAAQMARGVFSGQMSLDDLMTQLGERRAQESAQRIMGGGGTQQPRQQPTSTQRLLQPRSMLQGGGAQPRGGTKPQKDETLDLTDPAKLRKQSLQMTREARQLTAIGDTDRATRLEAQASDLRQMARDIEGAREFEPGAVRQRAEAEAEAEIEVAKGQKVPNIFTRAAGLPRGFNLTQGEAAEIGYFVNADPKDIREAHKHRAGARTTLRQIDQLTETLLRVDQGSRDELLGAVGGISRAVDSIISQAMAAPKLLGFLRSGKVETFRNSPEVRRIMDSEGLASQSSIVKSRIIDLAYNLARERESGRLSEQDIQRALTQIGESGSADQLIATVSDLRDRVRQAAVTEVASIVGAPPIDMMDRQELIRFARDVQEVGNDKLAGIILRRLTELSDDREPRR